MPLPQHKNPPVERAACAPYNFIPLPEVVVKPEALTESSNGDPLPDQDTYGNPVYKHTGYFDVSLTTKSPLYVRCGLSTRHKADDRRTEWEQAEEEKEGNAPSNFRAAMKNKPEFFYTDDKQKPVIPGSSLRGMIRSLLEIVTYSKMERVTNRQFFYRAVGDKSSFGNDYRAMMLGSRRKFKSPESPGLERMRFDYPVSNLKGGYLCRHQGKWAIRPAKTHENESFIHVFQHHVNLVVSNVREQTVHDVYIKPEPRQVTYQGNPNPRLSRRNVNLALDLAISDRVTASAVAGLVPAKLIRSGFMDGKHMDCAVYEADTGATSLAIPSDLWTAYEADAEMKRGDDTPTRHLGDGDPLFYLVDASGQLVGFGPTMMFRLRYKQSIHDLIPPYLRSKQVHDIAETMFGFVRENEDGSKSNAFKQGDKRQAFHSRVMVTDAILAGNPTPDKLWMTGSAAGTIEPRILGTPKATTFQHYLVQLEEDARNRSHYNSQTVIRGHKMFWHQAAPSIQTIKESTPGWLENGRVKAGSTQHTQFKPVRADNEFQFRVYFENFSDEELGALCWTLSPNGEPGTAYWHKLGMGKPYGLGSVHLNKVELFLTERKPRYQTLFDVDNWQTGAQQVALSTYIQMFEAKMLALLGPQPGCRSLAGMLRIGMLLRMMQPQDFPMEMPPMLRNCPLASNGKPNMRYMTIEVPNVQNRNEKNEFKDRKILPDPYWDKFGGSGGRSVASASPLQNSAPPVQDNLSSGQTMPVLPHLPLGDMDAPELKSISVLVGSVRGAGEVGKLESAVNRLSKLPGSPERDKLIQEIYHRTTKLGSSMNKQKEKSWYKELMGWMQKEQE